MANEWTSRNDRMPPVEDEVIYGYWARRVTPDGGFPEFQFFVGNPGRFDDFTHWMPLPEPPAEVPNA